MSEFNDEQKRELRSAKRTASEIEFFDERDRSIPCFGICNDCNSFFYREHEHGHNSIAMCRTFGEVRSILREDNKVSKCTDYSKRGQLSIESMWSIAHIIRFDEDPKIGFGDRKTRKVTITKNDSDEDELASLTFYDKDLGHIDMEGN